MRGAQGRGCPRRGCRTQVHKAERGSSSAAQPPTGKSSGNPLPPHRFPHETWDRSAAGRSPRGRGSRGPSPPPLGERVPHAGERYLRAVLWEAEGKGKEGKGKRENSARAERWADTREKRCRSPAMPGCAVPSRARPRRRRVRAAGEPPRPAPGARPAPNFRPTPPAAPRPRPGPGTGDTPRRPRRPPAPLTARPSSSSGSGGSRPRRRAAPAPCPGAAIPPPRRTRSGPAAAAAAATSGGAGALAATTRPHRGMTGAVVRPAPGMLISRGTVSLPQYPAQGNKHPTPTEMLSEIPVLFASAEVKKFQLFSHVPLASRPGFFVPPLLSRRVPCCKRLVAHSLFRDACLSGVLKALADLRSGIRGEQGNKK